MSEFKKLESLIKTKVSVAATKDTKEYYIYYLSDNSLRLVSKRVFSKVKGKFFKFNQDKSFCKVFGLTNKFKCEGIWDKAKNAFSGLKVVVDMLAKIGELAQGNYVLDVVMLGQIMNFVLDVYKLLQGECSVLDYIKLFSNGYVLYSRFSRGESIFVKGRVLQLLREAREVTPVNGVWHDARQVNFQTESLDSLGVAFLASFLPTKIFSVIQKLNMLTSQKIMDDKSIFHDLLSGLNSLITGFIELLPISESIKTAIVQLLDIVRISDKHVLLRKLEKINESLQLDPKLFLNRDLLKQCKEILVKVNCSTSLSDWCRLSKGVDNIVSTFRHNCKIIENNCSTGRVEPIAIVFEGPPGCGKSVAMSALIQVLGLSSYAHATKAMMDGKDWYDSYNNEAVFYMDDVGQQGNSQWRNVINMVSPVRLPLDCAEAKFKDTKFFNSELLLMTTNNLKNIRLMQTDCISHISALHRRCINVDFDLIRMDPVTGFYSGECKILFFDVKQGVYEDKLPVFLKQFLSGRNIKFSNKLFLDGSSESKGELIAWLCDFVSIMRVIKSDQAKSNNLNDEQLLRINSLRKFNPEGFLEQNLIDEIEYDREEQRLLSDRLKSLRRELNMDEIEDEGFLSSLFAGVDDSKDKFNWYKDLTICFFERMLEKIKSLLSTFSITNISNFVDNNFPEIMGLLAVAFLATSVFNVVRHFLPSFRMKALFLCKPHLKNDYNNYVLRRPFKADWKIYLKGEISMEQLDTSYYKNLYMFGSESIFKFENTASTVVDCISKQVRPVDCIYGNQTIQKCFGIISGHHIVLPSHVLCEEEFYVNIYNDVERTHRLHDQLKVSVTWKDNQADVGVVSWNKFKLSPWKNLSKFFKGGLSQAEKPFLVGFKDAIPLSAINSPKTYNAVYSYNINGIFRYTNSFSENSFFYMKRGPGMCGLPIVDQECGVLGIHVSGSAEVGVGVSMRWSDLVRDKIGEILREDQQFLMQVDINNKVRDGESVMRLEADVHQTIPKKSNFQPSPLYDIYPIEREPANLSKFGVGTVCEVAKKSFKQLKSVNIDEIKFAGKVIEAIIPNFSVITEEEIVGGNEWLAGLNKDSSNGFHCEKEKSFYINFETKQFTDQFRQELSALESQIENGQNIDVDKLVWFETLKDEIRDFRKEGVPRSFRVSTIHLQVLTKKYFGAMVEGIIKQRDFNQIMVGCNPAIEWQKIYDKLKIKFGIFDGDIEKFDGGMLAQLQTEAHDVILSKFQGSSVVPKFLLANTDSILLVLMNKLLMTTHSMPSGSFLTAILNSIVNRGYTAMWFWRMGGRSVFDFYDNVSDYVYGDDKIVATTAKFPQLTAKSFAVFMDTIGLGFTDANKKQVDFDFQKISDISFLKRGFVYHNKLKRIMCPLSLKTLKSGLSWFDGTKEEQVVMDGKLRAFQREIYLHPDYIDLKEEFLRKIKNYSYDFVELSDSYLESIYNDPNYIVPIKFGQYV